MEDTAAVVAWLEANLGGKVVHVLRQPRWRPVWFAGVETGGETLELMVRGDRSDSDYTWSLEHEMRFQRVLSDHGIRVPRVYGWIDDPRAFVTDRCPGQADFAGTSDEDRDRVVDEYLQELARIHALPLEPFIEAGIDHAAAAGPDVTQATLGIRRMEQMYRRQKVGPDPQLEFFLGWLRRNPPPAGREAPVVWDSGQFMHHGGRLVGIIDLELGHIGDPMMDLAGWRMRDSIVPFGDFDRLYARYEELSEQPVDIEAVRLHHLAFTLSNQLAFSHALLDPPPGSDFATNMQWCNETNLYATEALGEWLGIELPTVEVPPTRRSRVAPALAHLVHTLRTIEVDDEYARYRLRGAFRMARHVQRHDEIGVEVTEADLDDVHQLLGWRPGSWQESEEALERFVLDKAGDGSLDETLCTFFHRRNLRAQMLNGPEGSAMARHNPIQPFGPRPA